MGAGSRLRVGQDRGHEGPGLASCHVTTPGARQSVPRGHAAAGTGPAPGGEQRFGRCCCRQPPLTVGVWERRQARAVWPWERGQEVAGRRAWVRGRGGAQRKRQSRLGVCRRGPSGARFACVISRASRSPARADVIAMVTTVGTKEAEAQNRSATCLRSPRKRLTRGPSSGRAPGGHCGAPPLGGGVRLRDFRPRQGEAPATP